VVRLRRCAAFNCIIEGKGSSGGRGACGSAGVTGTSNGDFVSPYADKLATRYPDERQRATPGDACRV
jgi:hypothetical protein